MSNKKKTLGILTTLVSLFSLTSCNTEMIQDRIETTVNNMLPNLWITLLQLGLFILVAILFIVIAYKPLKKKLNERADYIEKNIKDSEKNIKDSETKALEAEEKIKEANRIVLNGQKKAGEIIQRAEKTAENKASELEKQLAETIEKQKQSAHNDIENERNLKMKETKCLKKLKVRLSLLLFQPVKKS